MQQRDMTAEEVAELYYLVGRLIGLRTRLGHNIDEIIYHEQFRIRIDVLKGETANE